MKLLGLLLALILLTGCPSANVARLDNGQVYAPTPSVEVIFI